LFIPAVQAEAGSDHPQNQEDKPVLGRYRNTIRLDSDEEEHRESKGDSERKLSRTVRDPLNALVNHDFIRSVPLPSVPDIPCTKEDQPSSNRSNLDQKSVYGCQHNARHYDTEDRDADWKDALDFIRT
jgi:hypothetical protein